MKKNKNIWIVQFCTLTFLLFFTANEASSSSYPEYRIKAEVNADRKEITANQQVTYTNQSTDTLPEIYFHVYPNRRYTEKEQKFMSQLAGYFKVNLYPEGFDSGGLDVHSIKIKGREASFRIEGEDETLLKITLPRPLRPGDKVTLEIDFTARLPHAYGRFGWHKNMIKLSRWYPILSVYNENGWNNHPFYPFHRPFFSDAAQYSVELSVPEEMVVIHSGVARSQVSRGSGQKLLSINSELPIREFSLAMSPDYQFLEETLGETAIKSYYLPGDEYHGQKALESAKKMMEFYSQKFGPYPYKEFSIAPVYLGYGGEQMSNLIFIDTRVYQLPKLLMRYLDFLVAHETGHQWFYNLVGTDEYKEMWMEEGIDSYFLLEHLENKYGYNAEVLEFPQWFEEWKGILPKLTFRRASASRYKILARTGMDHAIISKLSSFKEPTAIFSLAYGKGSYVVSMLKEQMGEEAFDRTFRRIFKEYRFKNLSLKDFRRICEQESGKDLSSFFEQWLYTDKKLNYAVDSVKNHRITLSNRAGIVMPAEVKVEYSSGVEETFVYNGEKKKETIDLDPGRGKIYRVTIDPDEKLLDLDRTNNVWPRHVTVHPAAIYLPLHELSALLPDDTYNLVVGPEIISGGIGVKASLQKPYEQIFYAGTGYEFDEELHHSFAGYEIKNLFETQTALGFEIANRTDLEDGDEDLVSGRAYLRRELWPAVYGLADINDHISFYLLRNHSLDATARFNGREDARNITYAGRDEAIVGTTIHFGRSGPYTDPHEGYVVDTLFENAGHFLGGTQSFSRASFDGAYYHPVTLKTTLAFRLKYGWGYPSDKSLYQLGGIDGLRGYDRKTIRGSNAALGSAEYRFPIKEDINMAFLDNIIGLESIGGVVFFDAGQSWFSKFDDSELFKNAGFGLRLKMNFGSFLEKVNVRADVAQAINDSDEEPRFWFGINHAF